MLRPYVRKAGREFGWLRRCSATPTRSEIHRWLRRDAEVARAWVQRQGAAGAPSARSFSHWCEDAADLLVTTEVVDIDVLTKQWQTQAYCARVEARVWPFCTALPALLCAVAAMLLPRRSPPSSH